MTRLSDSGPVSDLDALAGLLDGCRTVVLAGAGCSTESGIPDYRGPQGRMKTRTPVQYGDFVRSESSRRRYCMFSISFSTRATSISKLGSLSSVDVSVRYSASSVRMASASPAWP